MCSKAVERHRSCPRCKRLVMNAACRQTRLKDFAEVAHLRDEKRDILSHGSDGIQTFFRTNGLQTSARHKCTSTCNGSFWNADEGRQRTGRERPRRGMQGMDRMHKSCGCLGVRGAQDSVDCTGSRLPRRAREPRSQCYWRQLCEGHKLDGERARKQQPAREHASVMPKYNVSPEFYVGDNDPYCAPEVGSLVSCLFHRDENANADMHRTGIVVDKEGRVRFYYGEWPRDGDCSGHVKTFGPFNFGPDAFKQQLFRCRPDLRKDT